MTRFLRPGWQAARGGAPITILYLVAALLLGGYSDGLADVLHDHVSTISSASATAILSAISSGMIALTAIIFSLVLVAVQYGGTAYSPRLIRVLASSPFAAHALGIFTGTFLYSLLAIRTVDMVGSPGINASIVMMAFLWLLASLGALIRLLPQVRGFTISDVLAAVEHRAMCAIDRVYPSEGAGITLSPEPPIIQSLRHEKRPEYLVGLDVARLVRAASDADAVIYIPLAIGDPVIRGSRLALVHGTALDERMLRDAIWLADDRQIDNDPAYALRLLVDIAIRALSPAVNDPTTAVSVLDELYGLLGELGRRDLERDTETDQRGVVRLVRAVPSWDDLVALALTEIHQYGRDSLQVERRLSTLLRDALGELPPRRRAAFERFGRWRERTLMPAIDDARGWLDPLATDCQGIGHAGNGASLRAR